MKKICDGLLTVVLVAFTVMAVSVAAMVVTIAIKMMIGL